MYSLILPLQSKNKGVKTVSQILQDYLHNQGQFGNQIGKDLIVNRSARKFPKVSYGDKLITLE